MIETVRVQTAALGLFKATEAKPQPEVCILQSLPLSILAVWVQRQGGLRNDLLALLLEWCGQDVHGTISPLQSRDWSVAWHHIQSCIL